jgi:hypothetical protein
MLSDSTALILMYFVLPIWLVVDFAGPLIPDKARHAKQGNTTLR